jgi:Leucine-rich repeat (LRR) protein
MWQFEEFDEWTKKGRPIDENVVELDIQYSNIKTLGNLANLINLESLICNNNKRNRNFNKINKK